MSDATLTRTDVAVRADKPAARRPTVALALGGGGARGLAHVLMLEVFDELEIKPTIIAGTSIGAIFGAAYASGYSARQIRAHTEELLGQRYDFARQVFAARNEPIQRILNLLQLKSALLNPDLLLELALPSRMAADFEHLKIPLAIIAADYHAREQVVIRDGPLRKAIAASIALPVLFAPVLLGERVLMDGGIVNPLPFDVLDGAADIVVAVDVSGAPREAGEGRVPPPLDAVVSAVQMLQASIVREKMRSRQPDIYIDVDVDRFNVLDFRKVNEILEAATSAKAQLREKLSRVLGIEALPQIEPPRRG